MLETDCIYILQRIEYVCVHGLTYHLTELLLVRRLQLPGHVF